MRILQVNIQSVNTSRYFLNQAVHQHQPDVVALQEVWTLPQDFKINGYVLAAAKLRPTKKNEEDKAKKTSGEKKERNTCGTVESSSSNNGENNKEKKTSEEKKEKKSGGGVAIFCKDSAKIVDIGKTFETEGLEAIWADIMIKGKRFVIGSII